jgi:hypothetical protein
VDDACLEALAQALQVELAHKAPMHIPPQTLILITGLVQLLQEMLRTDPTIAPTGTVDDAERFLASVRHYFAECPAALALLRFSDPRPST